MKNILVIGATGMLGKPVTAALDKAGFNLTLLARDKLRILQQYPGKRIAPGNVFDLQTLIDAMKGNEIVYVNLSVLQTSKPTDIQPEREGINNIIAAAKQTGIKRIIYLSSLVQFYNGMNGFNWWAFDIKQTAVGNLKNSGIDHTIFYPSTFMEIFSNQLRVGNRVMLMSGSVTPMWFVAAADFANQVVNSLKIDLHGNRKFIVQGPEAYTLDEAAKLFVENCSGPKLKIVKAPISLMRLIGGFSQKINYGVNICEALNKYPEKFEAETTWRELGKPLIDISQFAKGMKE